VSDTANCPYTCHGHSNLNRVCSMEGGCGHLHGQVRLDGQSRCQLCRFPARTGGTLCWRHHDEVAHMLDPYNHGNRDVDIAASIPVLFSMLDPTPGGGGNTDRRPPGFASAPAANLHKLVMLDDRSVNDPQTWYGAGPNGKPDTTRPYTEEEEPPRAIAKAVTGLVNSLVEHLELEGPQLRNGEHFHDRTVPGLCAWMYDHIELITSHPDADDIYDDLRELSDQLRPAVGDRKMGPAGWCIELLTHQASGEYQECGCPLYLPPPTPDPKNQTTAQAHREVIVTCRRCYRPYTWLDLIRLRLIAQTA